MNPRVLIAILSFLKALTLVIVLYAVYGTIAAIIRQDPVTLGWGLSWMAYSWVLVGMVQFFIDKLL